jgi:hypothetical protein
MIPVPVPVPRPGPAPAAAQPPSVLLKPEVKSALISLAAGAALYGLSAFSPYASGMMQNFGFGLGLKGVMAIGKELKIVEAVSDAWKQYSTPRQGSSLLGAVCTLAVGGTLGYFAPTVLRADFAVAPALTASLGATAAWCVKSAYDLVSGTPVVAQPALAQPAQAPAQPQLNLNGLTFGNAAWHCSVTHRGSQGETTTIIYPNEQICAQLARFYDPNNHNESVVAIITILNQYFPGQISRLNPQQMNQPQVGRDPYDLGDDLRRPYRARRGHRESGHYRH